MTYSQKRILLRNVRSSRPEILAAFRHRKVRCTPQRYTILDYLNRNPRHPTAEEIYQAPKSWSQKAYVKLAYYGSHPKGTHFAVWEQPTLLVSDVRATFKALRA